MLEVELAGTWAKSSGDNWLLNTIAIEIKMINVQI